MSTDLDYLSDTDKEGDESARFWPDLTPFASDSASESASPVSVEAVFPVVFGVSSSPSSALLRSGEVFEIGGNTVSAYLGEFLGVPTIGSRSFGCTGAFYHSI
ncbi:hypothetical protein OAL43_00820 [bacterium]|nr:hypothetical protein [bacterium]